jgi:methyl-accepting chemotaxis protein
MEKTMPQKPTRIRRRQFYIKKDYQFNFILKFCLLVFGGALVSMGLLFLLSKGTLTFSFEHSRLIVKDTAFAILPAIILTNITTLVIVTLATIVVVLFVSHKIAGPMFRFEQDVKEIGQGNLTKVVRIRQKDQLKDFTGSLNHMTSSLHAKVLEIRKGLEQLHGSARQQDASEKLIEEIENLQQSIQTHFELQP